MNKPIIGIVGKPLMETDMRHYMEIVDDIRYVLIDNEKKDLEIIIDKLDGIILEGGLASNQYEEEIAKICINKNIPILGICSGFNILIRALGGKVHIDSNIFHNQFGAKIAHEVEIVLKILNYLYIKTNENKS